VKQENRDMDESSTDEGIGEVAYVLDEDAEEIIDICPSNEDVCTGDDENGSDDDDDGDDGSDSDFFLSFLVILL